MTSKNRLLLPAALTLASVLAACGSEAQLADTVAEPGVDLESTTAETGDESTASIEAEPEADDADTGVTNVAGGEGDATTVDATDPTTGEDSATTPTAVLRVAVPAGSGGDPHVEVQVEVMGLARSSGDTVRLDFDLSNLDGTEEFSLAARFGTGKLRFDVSGVSLVDLVGNNRYLVLVDSEGVCVCTTFAYSNETLGPGESRRFTAVFPAPPPETEVVDVQIPVIGVIADVAVTG